MLKLYYEVDIVAGGYVLYLSRLTAKDSVIGNLTVRLVVHAINNTPGDALDVARDFLVPFNASILRNR